MDREKKELEERLANPPNLYTQDEGMFYSKYMEDMLAKPCVRLILCL